MVDQYVEITCIEVKQPIGTFYVGAIKWNDLLYISHSDIRRIEREEKSEIESYFGIQRELSQRRLKDIANYVTFLDATFPSSIVLAISSTSMIGQDEDVSNVVFDTKSKTLKIRRDVSVAHIIDGQHRVFGIKEAIDQKLVRGQNFTFELIVTIFVDMDLDNQSMVFSTINKAQTKVNKSLVYDLFDLAKTKSPQRCAHNITRLLNESEGSPFKDKIKMLGKADDPLRETITQATLVESMLEYISVNPMADRDALKRGKKLDRIYMSQDMNKLFFRNWFIDDEDSKIADVMWNYFGAVKEIWPNAWHNTILSKSTGVIALMKFLKPIVIKLGTDKVISQKEFYDVLGKIGLRYEDFNTQNYVPGAMGSSKLYKDLLSKSGLGG